MEISLLGLILSLQKKLRNLSDKVANQNALSRKIVDSLPISDIDKNIIYMVRRNPADQDDNVYIEYINTDGTSDGWEIIGDTRVDLTDYIKNTDYATIDRGGVVKVSTSASGSTGVYRRDDGLLLICCAERADISKKESYNKPITPINLNFAVESCTNQEISDSISDEFKKLPVSVIALEDYVTSAIQSSVLDSWEVEV